MGSRKFDRVAERADAMAGGRMGEPGLTDWVPQQLGAVKRQIQLIQNVSPQHPLRLVNQEKTLSESKSQKNQIEMDCNGRGSSTVKTDQFVNLRGIDWDSELVDAFPWEQRYICSGIEQHQHVCLDSAGPGVAKLNRAHGRWRAVPGGVIVWHWE